MNTLEIKPTWSRFFAIMICLHGLALLTSMAGMELLSWSIFLSFVLSLLWVWRGRLTSRDFWSQLRVGPDWALGAFWLVLVLSGIFSPVSDAVWWKIFGEGRWILLLYALAWAWRQVPVEQWPKIFRGFFVLVFVIGLYALAQFIWGVEFTRSRQLLHEVRIGDDFYYRASGFFNLCLTFAYSIGIAGFLAAGFLWRTPVREWLSQRNRYAMLGAFGAVIACLASVSRGSWVAIAVASCVMLLLVNRKRLIGFLVTGGIAVYVVAMANVGIRDRLLSIADLNDRSNWLRTAIWQINWQMFLDHPWLGVGLSMNSVLSKRYFERMGFHDADVYSHAHNNLLNMLSCTGIFGFLAFVAFSLYFIRQSYRCYRRFQAGGNQFLQNLALGTLGAQLYMHIGGLTESNFTDGEVNHMVIMVWALVVALSHLNLKPSHQTL